MQSRLLSRSEATEVMVLSRYIKHIIVAICVVVFLVACGTQTVGDGEVDATEVPTLYQKEVLFTCCAVTSTLEMQETTTEQITEQEAVEKKEYVTYFTEDDVKDIAKLLLRECGGVPSKTEQACVAWCVLNRVDEYGSSIHEVLRSPNQFAFYESTEVQDGLYDLAKDVLSRWNDERNGISDVGRVLPKEYTYFHGDGVHNYFRNSFDGDYETWDYSLESPYED